MSRAHALPALQVPWEGWAVPLPPSSWLYSQASRELGILLRDSSVISKRQSPLC